MSQFDGINLTIAGHIAALELARPDTLNAFDETLHRAFTQALRHLHDQAEVRCLLLTAQGKVFSAGGSYDFMEQCANDVAFRNAIFEDCHRLFTTLTQLPFPVVTAMHGDAMGLGATIVTCSDIVVTHRAARLADPHVRVGLAAGDGGVAGWTLAAGLMRAKRHLLTGDALDGALAYQLGLVTDLVDDAAAVGPAARTLAERIAALPPLAVRGTKLAFNALARDMGQSAFEVSMLHESRCFETRDLREAVAAARQKRKGTFIGK